MKFSVIISLIVFGLFLNFTASGKLLWEKAKDSYYGDPFENPRYVEGRISINDDKSSREFEAVIVFRIKSYDNCEEVLQKWNKIALDDCEECKLSKIECDAQPRDIYIKMLNNENNNRTTYLQATNPVDDYRKLILLFWGLTKKEAAYVCNLLLTSRDMSKRKNLRKECINPTS